MAIKIKRGFTLVELMVTIAVLAIIATIAVPSFSQQISRQSLDNSAREILSALNEGRSRAVALRSSVIVCPNKTSGGTANTLALCATSTISGVNGEKLAAQNRVILANISSRTDVTSTVAGVVFLPMGTVQSRKTFTLCAMGVSKKIDVAVTGASEISIGNC